MAAVREVSTTSAGGACRSTPSPSGERVKRKGTRNAGRVYFQVSIIVRKGLPSVRAAAAKGERAVGGLTSERTA